MRTPAAGCGGPGFGHRAPSAGSPTTPELRELGVEGVVAVRSQVQTGRSSRRLERRVRLWSPSSESRFASSAEAKHGRVRPTNSMAASRHRLVLPCLVGLGLALLLVGVVSGTLLRHVVQITPIMAAAVLLARRPAWGAYASLPIFLFWIFIVALIWLYLLGLSRMASGRYTPIEVASTVLMAGFAVVGIAAAVLAGRPLRWRWRVCVVALFAVAQVAAMWVSLLRPIANR